MTRLEETHNLNLARADLARRISKFKNEDDVTPEVLEGYDLTLKIIQDYLTLIRSAAVAEWRAS